MTSPVPRRKSKVEIMFPKELAKIKDSSIKQFVIDAFKELCPNYFWTVPCSTSGKYHPQYALGKGGLVRHVRSAIWWGIELAKSMELEHLNDEMVAALLLHDIIKNGKGLNDVGRPLESGMTGTHGVTLSHKLMGLDFPKTTSFYMILTGIACHMGIWTTDPTYRPKVILELEYKQFADLVHMADYCASRKADDLIKRLQSEKTKTIQEA